jgi:hypothetical protein
VCSVPVGLAAQRFAESPCGERDRGERPGCRGFYEELPTFTEVGSHRAPRIDSAAGPVLINEANRDVANAMCETSDGEREPAERILT